MQKQRALPLFTNFIKSSPPTGGGATKGHIVDTSIARRKRQASITVLDRNGNDKVITAMVWKTTTGETFEMKTID